MKKQFTCIVCPNGCEIEAEVENGQVISVTGHTCLAANSMSVRS